SIYTSESGGTPVWSEFQSVFPSQGLFSTTFGNQSNPFPAGMFDTPLFLGVKVGTDDEMTPRRALTSVAYALKANDANTLGGNTAQDLDQSSDIQSLSTTTDTLQTILNTLENNIESIESQVSSNNSDVITLTNALSLAESDIDQAVFLIQDNAAAISTIDSVIPLLQQQIGGSCQSGSFMVGVTPTGNVQCATDNSGPWSTNLSTHFVPAGHAVAIGTANASADLFIDSASGGTPLRARVSGTTALMVHENRSVSVGTAGVGPNAGLYVLGDVGVGAFAPNAKLTTSDPDWQFSLRNPFAGGAEWFVGSSADSWAAGGGKFVVSNVASSSSAPFVIDADENVGIANVSPSTRLHIGSGSDVAPGGGGFMTLGSDTSINVALDNNEIMARNNGNAAPLTLNAEGGEVRVNTGGNRNEDAFEVRGRVVFDGGTNGNFRITQATDGTAYTVLEPTSFETGYLGRGTFPFRAMYSREYFAASPLNYSSYSDRRLKTNIQPIRSAVDTIKQLEGVSYAFVPDTRGQRAQALSGQERFASDHQLGFIAQDVADVLPQLVREDPTTGLKTVAYMGLIPVLVEALKTQQAMLEAQQAELEQLKLQLN
ncbi:MAG: tail fiber domain-containing protein, partial [Pseudomonadota bacterium]